MNNQIEHALNLLRSGDAEAPEEALKSLRSVIYSFGMKVCGDPDDAEDTTQETLVRLTRSLGKFTDSRALAVWLYKVAKTQCLMSRRQSKFAPKETISLDSLMVGRDEASRARR